MQLPDVDDVVELVRRDILAGLAGLDEDGRPLTQDDTEAGSGRRIFTPQPQSDDSAAAFQAAALTPEGSEVQVVEWVYRCKHDGDFPGVVQTNKNLVIEGITVVDRRNPDRPLRRYVDWSRVMSELGVSATFRPEVERLDDLPSYQNVGRQAEA
jgi:hypothetical protein